MTTYQWMNSPAFRALPPRGHKALPHFQAKVKLAINNPQRYMEQFTLSYGELKQATGMTDQTCSKTFQDLVKFGLIDPVEKGGLRGHGKTCSKYKLSRRWERFGQTNFQDVDLKTFVA